MKTLIAYIVTIATVIAAAIFARTIVEAAIYVPGSTGVLASSTLYHSPDSSPDSNSSDSDLQVPPVSSATVATAAKNVAVIPPAYPVRLDIPALDIDANVQDVGITARGNMGTPDNFTDVGWYTYGSIPGQQGTSIIDGHVNNGLGLAGVFVNLSDIETGDDIYVTNHAGQRVHFVVTDIEYYGYEDAPTSEIFGSGQGTPTLKLITCGGAWVPDQKTYDERLVVTAQLVQ